MDLTATLARAQRNIASFDLRRALSSPIDIVIGVGLAACAFLTVLDSGYGAIAAVLLATGPHVVRGTYPWLTIGLTFAGAVLIVMVHPRADLWAVPVLVSGVLSFHTLQSRLDRRSAWLLCGVAVVIALFAMGAVYFSEPHFNGMLAAAVVGGSSIMIATTLVADVRRSRTEAAEARVDNLETLREQAAMAERARIAREMHDIVAHSISMIAVQAETAPYTISHLGDEAKQEFAQIAAAARGTLTEMRRLLGVLRADVRPETAPQPGLARLPELIQQHDGEVDLDIVGEEREVPQAVDVSAYRILQEALTNARTHAPGARVSIEIAYRPTLLALRIADDGPGPVEKEPGEPAARSKDRATGHGLIGMRERATALGGWFTAGPGPEGGFLILAGLPTE